ncbi:glycine-rich domain-containing protein [Falsirhodobacter xinxiangensis]|uniref:glycine-rich domain-containing protein n=1 Tax=Falsirhodobacter xinxiangensis TaxID=2530049 RepID=UPI0010AA97A1
MAVNEAASGGVWSTVQIDGKWYRLGRFTAVSSALAITSAMALEVLLVGAGGTGGTGGSRGGGGGGGWVRVDTVQVQPGIYTIEVGVASSATASTVGNPSRAVGLTAPGGGAGGPSAAVGGDGGNGGGGGGSGGAAVPNLAGGAGNPGFAGGRGFGGTITQRASGGGGGAGGAGVGGSVGLGGAAGPGRSINFDGTLRVYGTGGRGSGPALPAVPEGATNPGAGGDGGSSGFGAAQNGIVIVRYEITDPFLAADHPGATFWSETIDGVPYKGMTIPASAGLTSLKPLIPVDVEYLLVAGGGGAPYYQAANTGGGGAGGLLRPTRAGAARAVCCAARPR